METTIQSDGFSATLKQLSDRASSLLVAGSFPHPDFTPSEHQTAVVEHRQELSRLVTAAEAAGKPDIAKQARQFAKQMGDLEARWQSRIAKS